MNGVVVNNNRSLTRNDSLASNQQQQQSSSASSSSNGTTTMTSPTSTSSTTSNSYNISKPKEGQSYLDFVNNWTKEEVIFYLKEELNLKLIKLSSPIQQSEYFNNFLKNEINGSIFLNLNQLNLKNELNFKLVGDRIKILLLIKNLRFKCSLDGSTTTSPSPSTTTPTSPTTSTSTQPIPRNTLIRTTSKRIPPPLHLTPSNNNSNLTQAYQPPPSSSSITTTSNLARTSSQQRSSSQSQSQQNPGSPRRGEALPPIPSTSSTSTSTSSTGTGTGTGNSRVTKDPRSNTVGSSVLQSANSVSNSSSGSGGNGGGGRSSSPISNSRVGLRTTTVSGSQQQGGGGGSRSTTPNSQYQSSINHRKTNSGSNNRILNSSSPSNNSNNNNNSNYNHPYSNSSNNHNNNSPTQDGFLNTIYSSNNSRSIPSTSSSSTASGGVKNLLPSPAFNSSSSSTASTLLSPVFEQNQNQNQNQRPSTPLSLSLSTSIPSSASTTSPSSSSASNVQGLEQVLKKTIKFYQDTTGISKFIAVFDCLTGEEVLRRVLKKFGIPVPSSGGLNDGLGGGGGTGEEMGVGERGEEKEEGEWGIFAVGGDGAVYELNSLELFKICKDSSAIERTRGLILRRLPSPSTSSSSSNTNNGFTNSVGKRVGTGGGNGGKLSRWLGENNLNESTRPGGVTSLTPLTSLQQLASKSPTSPNYLGIEIPLMSVDPGSPLLSSSSSFNSGSPRSNSGSPVIGTGSSNEGFYGRAVEGNGGTTTKKKMNRASTISIMSSLSGIDWSGTTSSGGSGENEAGDYNKRSYSPSSSLDHHNSNNFSNNNRSPSASSLNSDRLGITGNSSSGSPKNRKLRNFFGQRPPSELISSHLTEYFPRVLDLVSTSSTSSSDSHLNNTNSRGGGLGGGGSGGGGGGGGGKLSKSVRMSVRKSLIRRESQFGLIAASVSMNSNHSNHSNNSTNSSLRENISGGTSWDRNSIISAGGGGNGYSSRFSGSSLGSNSIFTTRNSQPLPPLPLDLNTFTTNPKRYDSAGRFSDDESNSSLGHSTTNTTTAVVGETSPINSFSRNQNGSSSNNSNLAMRRLSKLSNYSNSNNRLSGIIDFTGNNNNSNSNDRNSIITVDEITAEVEARRETLAAVRRESLITTSGSNYSNASTDDDEDVQDGNRSRDSDLDGLSRSGRISENVGLRPHSIAFSLEDDLDEVDDEEDDLSDEEDDEEEEEDSAPAEISAKSTLKWIKGALIGAGSFGSVYLGMNPTSGSLMAVKQVELPTGNSHNEERKKSMLDALEREIELLKVLQHENIVQYLDSSSDATHLNIFLEYVPGGSVAALLSNYGAFEEALVSKFVRQILTGLEYLHTREIIHRDIKGANILVDNKGGIKISDFGISKKVEDNLLSGSKVHRPSLQGSVYWMAPEVVKQTAYTSKADIWSLGCLVVEMLTGVHPWANLTQMQAIFRIGSSVRPTVPDDITSDATEFLDQTFLIDYNARPSARTLLQHPFIKEIIVLTPAEAALALSQQTPTRATFSQNSSPVKLE